MSIDELFGPLEVSAAPSCELCGDAFKPRHGKRFCSDRCRNKAGHKRIDRFASAPEHHCERCGIAFRRRVDAKNVARFCSRSCSDDTAREIGLASRQMHAQAACLIVAYRVARCRCGECGKPFTAQSLASKYCSGECSSVAAQKMFWARRGVDSAPRKCPECDIVFEVEYGRGAAVYCSDRCSKRHNGRKSKSRRRAILRGADNDNVNPFDVFDRDGWKCQLCGISTPKRLRGTHDARAPELDHILPLSRGGQHTYLNTQCSCRSCNQAKGDTPLGQMRLIG